MRVKTIKLGYCNGIDRLETPFWQVLVVKNSTEYNPGETLTKKQVNDDLIESPRWDVTIVTLKTEAA